jgi:GNAT superfamily N-acetyltransferase
MTPPHPLSSPKILPGPPVHGEPTIASIFSTAQLTTSPFLPSLVRVINLAFNASHDAFPELNLHTHGNRLASTDELLSGLQDPETFVLIISRPESEEVIATSSARRYFGSSAREYDSSALEQKKSSPWERTAPVEPGAEEWELKLMATDPSAQGQGLAKWMMETVEAEIVARSKAKWEAMHRDDSSPPKLRMVLCTLREIMGEFYLRKGYVKDYELERGEGYAFHIIHLSKTITA